MHQSVIDMVETTEKETIKATIWHCESDRGVAFLEFVDDPLTIRMTVAADRFCIWLPK